jgi:hypothetical protein
MLVNLVRTPMLASINYEPTVPLVVCFFGLVAYLVASLVLSARYFKWR